MGMSACVRNYETFEHWPSVKIGPCKIFPLYGNFRFLYIPLVCAERAWALGMELKQAANTEHRKRFHLMRRLQRAVKHASELVQLCEGSERYDARTRLEA